MKKKISPIWALAYLPGVAGFTTAFGFFVAEFVWQNRANLQAGAWFSLGLTVVAIILSIAMFFQKKKIDREDAAMKQFRENSIPAN